MISDNSESDPGLTQDRQLGVGSGGQVAMESSEPVPQMFAELELEYLVKLRPGSMGLEVWGKSAQNVSRRTFCLFAGSLVTAGLLFLFFRDKVSNIHYHSKTEPNLTIPEKETPGK